MRIPDTSRSEPSPKASLGTVSLDTVIVVMDGVVPHEPDRAISFKASFEDGKAVEEGFLGNLRVRVTEGGTVVMGSLARFLHGSNAYALTPADVEAALREVEARLGLPEGTVDIARVGRVDVGANIAVTEDPRLYLAAAVEVPGSARHLVSPVSLRFQTRRRAIAFYDKRAQITRSGGAVPAEWGGAPVLRYELRFLKATTRAFGRALYASDLWNEAFHADLVRRWAARFGTVRFARALRLGPASSVRSLRDRLALRGVEAAGGLASVMASVDTARATGLVTSDVATRMRQWVRRLTADPALTDDSDLARELGAAVRTAAALHK